MSENNYGALMLKSALDISVDVTKITSPGIYPIIQGNASVPDASSGLLKVSLTPSKPQITFQKENSSVVYSFVNGNWEKPTATDVDALAKSQNGADIPNKPLFLQNVGLKETINLAKNAVPATRRVNSKPLTGNITLSAGDVGALPVAGGRLNGPLGIGTDNALGGNSIVFGDNDTGFKWHSDGVLGIYANNALVGYIDNSGLHMSVDVLSNGAIRAGNAKKLSLTSNNNSALTATFNLWGGPNRPTVIELDDDQGWHLYSQRNPDGSIVFTVNGDITANTLRAGGAIYANNGDVSGTVWGGGNAAWLSGYLYSNMVKAVRLGPVALSGGLWRDFQLGGGQVVTGFHTDGSWEMEGGDDKVYYRPIQYLVGDTWVTAPSV
ncbi:hypothetical protein HYL62_001247 [Salmonella enterica]|nr:hypothetical protein [Salmonella enterica]EFR5200491.1 hypothetical protein [Salmonella enterica]EFR5305501.1 hypothetical protein [Salmonella enterica]EFR5600226.1 hypothetical protein [Salmonella enterica]